MPVGGRPLRFCDIVFCGPTIQLCYRKKRAGARSPPTRFLPLFNRHGPRPSLIGPGFITFTHEAHRPTNPGGELRWPTITVISLADSVDQLTIKVASTSFTLTRLDAGTGAGRWGSLRTRVRSFGYPLAATHGERSCIATAYGCFTFAPLIAIHSKKPSIGTMQRRLRYASRNIGSRSTVSALALIGGGFGFSLHQYGMSPRRQAARLGSRAREKLS